MEFRQIQYFICLFEEGTVTKAARRLNIVQPALSMQISKLEQEVGQRLFERSPQGMLPTATARHMYRLFLPIMRDFSQARDEVLCNDGEIAGHVNIGLIASITEGVLAETMTKFSASHPKVSVTVADGYSATLSDWVAGGQLDAAIINKPRRPLALSVDHIVDEELVLITGTRHAGNLPARLTLGQIASQNLSLVLTTRRHGLRHIIDSFAQHDNVELAPSLEVDSLVTVVKLVEQNQLATILPRIAVHDRLRAGILQAHAIVSPRLIRQVVSVVHPRRPLNPAAAAFMAMLTRQIRLRAQEQAPGAQATATPHRTL
ncbi:MAG: LysR family transcriptional regulator [Bordetella sp. SCN 67-23]|nr:LysR family transcriptional regulator [Burkholderiales bacterium]ODS73570.1 MAG: LysR family transcriptional regulator [Bordetella sp. SCN 67-23]ODU80418.1 MAG: LysR family transcriptional regulator [Bordetella sp. SCN 68-11]OJW89438.1 MAG: LysR family transcriptional regulator [Burkholderiales bacterium 67-32]